MLGPHSNGLPVRLLGLVVIATATACGALVAEGQLITEPSSSPKEAASLRAQVSSEVRFTLGGRVEAILRRNGKLLQSVRRPGQPGGSSVPAMKTFGSLRPDWTFVSPTGVVFARLHGDGRLALAHGNPDAVRIGRDGSATLPNGHRLGLNPDGSLTGVPTDESAPRLAGVSPSDRRAAMFVFFAWSLTNARIQETRTEVRAIRRTVDLARIQGGDQCPRSVKALIDRGLLARSQRTTDTWGSELNIQCARGTAPLVVSPGPDRRAGTSDDIRSDR